MISWRDLASQVAQDDFDTLLNAVLPFATQALERRGGLYPFGSSVSVDGEVGLSSADAGGSDSPRSRDLLQLLYDGVIAEKDSLRAAAYVADVRVEGEDAIRVQLEHAEGTAIEILLPYQSTRFRKKVTLGEMRVQAGEPHAWKSVVD